MPGILAKRNQTRRLEDTPVSSSIRLLAWARAVYWIGWGFGEPLLPVFILLFSKSFAEMGLLSSAVEIASLISLPIIGMWADKSPAKTLVIWSLVLYPFVGISYFLAGFLGVGLFLVIARVINGFNWELQNIGIDTYYRRVSDSAKIGASFGYIDTWSNLAWVLAALAGTILVRFLPIYYLLFAITPFSLIALAMALRVPKDMPGAKKEEKKISFLNSYGKAVHQWRTWNLHLWLLSILVLFAGVVNSLMYFFIPADAYLQGANLPMVVLISVFGALPLLFGYNLGRIIDRKNKYSLITIGLLITAIVAIGLAVIPYYWFKLVAVFISGIVLEMFSVVERSLVTTLGPSETYGERGSSFESVIVLADLAAPVILGVFLDLVGFSFVTLGIGVIAVLLSVVYVSVRKMKIP